MVQSDVQRHIFRWYRVMFRGHWKIAGEFDSDSDLMQKNGITSLVFPYAVYVSVFLVYFICIIYENVWNPYDVEKINEYLSPYIGAGLTWEDLGALCPA